MIITLACGLGGVLLAAIIARHPHRFRWWICDCRRERMPWFSAVHNPYRVMVGLGWMFALFAAGALLFGSWWAVAYAATALWQFKCARLHGGGRKRRRFARLLGRVRLSIDGRLVVGR